MARSMYDDGCGQRVDGQFDDCTTEQCRKHIASSSLGPGRKLLPQLAQLPHENLGVPIVFT